MNAPSSQSAEERAIEIYGDVDVNQIWRSRREHWRTVRIDGLFVGRGEVGYAHVNRNTSRRKQAISLPVLRRDYEKVSR